MPKWRARTRRQLEALPFSEFPLTIAWEDQVRRLILRKRPISTFTSSLDYSFGGSLDIFASPKRGAGDVGGRVVNVDR